MAELLLEKGYEVHGLVRRVAIEDPVHRMSRVCHLIDEINFHAASLESLSSIFMLFNSVRPDECYHLAAQSFVSYSFEDEFSTMNTNINGTHHVLAAIKEFVPTCRFYFAGSSEMFGNTREVPQNENTPFNPRSSYSISKLARYHLTKNYREAFGIHASSGIFYNHESPRRGYEFVTRKITSHVARIKLGLAHSLKLGNLDAKRDWGHAKDYVLAMWMMLQQPEAGDYVISTGKSHSVKEFLEVAFSYVGLNYTDYVVLDPRLVRPAEIHLLVGNSEKAKRILGWTSSISFEDLVHEMVDADLESIRKTMV